MSGSGYVKLHRKILESQVFHNEGLLKVWVWCLLRANHKGSWVPVTTGRGTTEIYVQPGQFIFGRKAAAKELRMKPSSLRDRVKKLEKMQNIATQPDTHYSLISIVNWSSYQTGEIAADTQPDNQATTNRQPSDTDKNVKNVKKEKTPEESGAGLATLRARYDEKLLDEVFTAIASTRRSGKVADSVLANALKAWEKFPLEQVEYGCRTYLDRNYAAQGKNEKYLTGIIRNGNSDRQADPEGSREDWWKGAII
jgi:hypothetical protein